jgi:hypothetical protein
MIPNNNDKPSDEQVASAINVLINASADQIDTYVQSECDGIDDRMSKLAQVLEVAIAFALSVRNDACHLGGEHDYIYKYKCYGDKELENMHQDLAEHHAKLGEIAEAPVEQLQSAVKNIKANI